MWNFLSIEAVLWIKTIKSFNSYVVFIDYVLVLGYFYQLNLIPIIFIL